MSKKSNGHKALEARRRKNRRQHNLALAQERMSQVTPTAVAVAEQPSAPPKVGAWQRRRDRSAKRAPWRSNPWVTILLCALAPAVILYGCQLITLQDGGAVLSWLRASSGAARITYGALLGILVLLFSVIGSLFWSTMAVAVPVLVFAFANHMKLFLNGSPILISDLALAGSPGELLGFLRPGLDIGDGTRLAILVAAVLLAVIATVGCRTYRTTARWRVRLGGSVLGVVTVALCLTLSPAQAVLTGHQDEIQAERNDRLGLLAGFYSGWRDSAIRQPNDYSENNMNSILRATQQAAASSPTIAKETAPNVILLMSESFCDPEVVLPGIDFQDDPIPNYHALAQRYPSGAFLSNTYAGGTGNVEMEVLTGLPIAFLGSGEDLTALRDSTAYQRVPSIVKAFQWQDYATEFVHSYNSELYNRAENLPAIGFEKVLFDDSFPEDAKIAGGYLSDLELADKLIREFERRDSNKPLFLYGLSMENHQPYFGQKFDEPSGLRYSGGNLDEAEQETMDNLLHGLHDADAALGVLTRYFEQREEPTIIVFWGDHLPGLNTGLGKETLYSLLGYVDGDETKDWDSDTMKKMHSTRFLVWNNYGADLSVPAEMSTLGLGTHILDWAGVEKPLYYHWVDLALEDMLLYRQRLFITGDGEPHSTAPDSSAVAQDYRNLVYDIIYGRGYISGEMTANPRKD